jgi:inorganic pyrophosphatase
LQKNPTKGPGHFAYRGRDNSLSGIPFNYGFVPQTWEGWGEIDHLTGFVGDGDPLDCLLYDSNGHSIGDVCVVEIVGALVLVDQGENDWNAQLNEVKIEKSWVSAVFVDWFRNYMIPELSVHLLRSILSNCQAIVSVLPSWSLLDPCGSYMSFSFD